MRKTLPATAYRDETLFQSERRHIFARSWLLVAHESQLQTTGEYVALTAAGYPLIMVRGDDGKVRAFHNVCRHRGSPIAPDGPGKCDGTLACMYHGWRYDLDGRLTGARDFGADEGFDPRDFGLIEIKCDMWRGFVFVNMYTVGTESLASFIAPLDERAKDLPLESFRLSKTTRHDLACNWKTYVENYLETYHIPQIHPFLNSAVDVAKMDCDVVPPGVFWRAPQKSDTPVSGLWAWMWPSLSINIYNDGILMERVWPVTATSTRLDFLYLFPSDATEEVIAQTLKASETTTGEDKTICEAVQRNLDAGIFDTGILSPKHEQAVGWFQNEVRRFL